MVSLKIDIKNQNVLKGNPGTHYSSPLVFRKNKLRLIYLQLLLSEKTCRHCSLFWVSFSVLSATFLVQHSMSIGVLQCNSHFFVKNTWNIRYSLTNINLLYLKIYKRHNLPLQKEKNAYLYFFEYFYFPFWKQRLCHLYILGKVDLYF